MEILKSIYRTNTCDELNKDHVGSKATLSGWISRKRDHGGIIFIDLRDNYGITQAVFSGNIATQLEDIRVESVIKITGEVVLRNTDLINSKISTGEIELKVNDFELLSSCEVLPFQVSEEDKTSEQLRLKYRYLDLRREKLHKNILLRSKVIQKIRELMFDQGFNEFQTPILTSSSPEGARDFIVPSRLHPGKFFALPQAPQQFKQLLMVSGFDRYFQIAPCFRDEDPRANRTYEFYQLDMEMSFVDQDDVFQVGEYVFPKLFKTFTDSKVSEAPYTRIKFKDAISKYGSDKPDLRIPIEISKVTEIFKNTSFKIFKNAIDSKDDIFVIPVSLDEIPSRKYLDETVQYFTKLSGKGLGYILYDLDGYKGSFAKLLSEEEILNIQKKYDFKKGIVFFAAGREGEVELLLGNLRLKLGKELNLIEKDTFKFCWIVDFPLFEKDKLTNKIEFSHNPFSMPHGGLEALKNKNPLDINAYQYDLVCNGEELASGAIRNQNPEIMYKAFEIAGYSKEDVDSKFGGMISAFKFGTPPHGGMAPGIERIVMLLAQETSLREVVAFPMSQTGEDLMMGAPGLITSKQLNEVHIKVIEPPKNIELK